MGDAARVKVSDEGLLALASQCDATAAALTRGATPSLAGLPNQATVAAVRRGQGLINTTAEVLASRLTATGRKLRSAATSYTSTDGGAADQIAGAARSIDTRRG